jgi:hypothetical protein
MPKLKHILIIAAVILTFGIAWKYFKRFKDTEKLKLGSTSLKSTKKIESFKDLGDIFINGFNVKGFIEIRNFSGKDYTLNQLSLDCYSPKTQKLVAEQTNILPGSLVLKSNQVTNIPLEYNIDIINSLSLFRESEVIPADATIWQIVSKPATYWDKVHLKQLKVKLIGFIQAEGITLSVNEDYLLL